MHGTIVGSWLTATARQNDSDAFEINNGTVYGVLCLYLVHVLTAQHSPKGLNDLHLVRMSRSMCYQRSCVCGKSNAALCSAYCDEHYVLKSSCLTTGYFPLPCTPSSQSNAAQTHTYFWRVSDEPWHLGRRHRRPSTLSTSASDRLQPPATAASSIQPSSVGEERAPSSSVGVFTPQHIYIVFNSYSFLTVI